MLQFRRYLKKLQDSNKKWIHAIIWCIIPEPKVFLKQITIIALLYNLSRENMML